MLLLLVFQLASSLRTEAYVILDNGAVASTIVDRDNGGQLANMETYNPLQHQGSDVIRPMDIFRNVILDNNYLWPGGIIPYEFSDDLIPSARKAIQSAINDFHSMTCLKFVQRSTEKRWVKFISGAGCYSYIGRQPYDGAQEISIGPFCDQKGTVLHEIMHTIGFFHEHNRNDRDSYVNVLWENIATGKEYNFRKNDGVSYVIADTLKLRYDYGSIMHYGERYFSANGLLPTLKTKFQESTIGQRTGFSDYDVVKIRKVYRCNSTAEVMALNNTSGVNVSPTMSSTSTTTTVTVPRLFAVKPDCEDSDAKCKTWVAGDGCLVYPGLTLFFCKKSCDNCDAQKCHDSDYYLYSSFCKAILTPADPRCLQQLYKIFCPKTCAYCI